MLQKELIPTVFALDKETFDKKLEKLSFSKKLHLDFMDGKFTEKSSLSIKEMESISNHREIEFEIHLMAYEPEQYIGKISKLGISKVLLQFEAFETDSELSYSIDTFKQRGIEVFLVLNPGTDIEEATPYIDEIEGVMLMSVWPGMEGQNFISNTYTKIKKLKESFPNLTVQIDGGIKTDNAREILKSGADILSVGSFISSSKIPEEKYTELSSVL